MVEPRSRSVRRIGAFLTSLGIGLLVAGALAGWVLPHVSDICTLLPASIRAGRVCMIASILRMAIPNSGFNVTAYLEADITALAVIIAVLIGFSASSIQIAGQTHSLALIRAILLSLAPFLLCWSIATGITLIYLLIMPPFLVQLCQVFLWFGAVVLLMIGYLWELPWRLSGEYAALWAILELQSEPIGHWEALDGFSVLQTGLASASTRGDLVTVRAMATSLGSFLAGAIEHGAAPANMVDRARYRALKNLLSGCAQHAGSAPNPVAYYLGFVTAGVLLQASAIGLPVGDADYDLFSGLFRAIRGMPERVDPLWTGMRHGLCRRGFHGEPYMMNYWRDHQTWALDDPRKIQRVAEGVFRIYANCCREVHDSWTDTNVAMSSDTPASISDVDSQFTWHSEEIGSSASELLIDLYRDVTVSLGKELATVRHHRNAPDPSTLCLDLLQAIHQLAMRTWPSWASPQDRVSVENAYNVFRADLTTTITSK